jgi:hypothetical protein
MADERIDSMGVPITGSRRDENVDALERRVRNQFEKPVQDAEEFIKFKILEALKDVESLDAPTKAVVAGLAVSREAKGNKLFNRAVEQLNLPVEVQQIGNDFAASKQFQGVLGENSNLGVSAYRPESGDAALAAQVSKQYPGAFGRDSNLGFTGSVSTQGDPRFAVDARKEFRNPLGPNSDASIGAGYDSEAGPRFEARIQQTFSEGGRVNMNKPRITQGLTNLLNKYSTGPLAGAGNVSRGTPVQSFAPGGPVSNYNPRLDPSLDFSDPLNPPEGYEYLGLGGESGQVLTGADDFIYVGDPVADAPLDLVTTTPPVTANTSPVSTTPAYTDAPVAETVNFVDNPVLSVPVVAPVAPTPVAPVPVPPTPVAPTPVAPTPVAAAPVAVSEPIPNPVTYPTAAVDPVVAPIDDTPLPPSVYTPPLPPVESVYTPPAATVVDTPETLFTPPPPVFEVPEAKPYNYLQDLRPNFDISDVIKTQTSGYTPTQGMVINPTQYQYPGAPEITGDNVYVPEIYQSRPSLELSTVDVEDLTDTTGTTDTADTAGETDTEDTADTTQGTSFASLDSLSSNQQAYNREQDYADRYGYTLEELRQINAERLRMGLPRLQDLHRDIGDINFSGGM